MVYQPTQKKTADAHALLPLKFQEFVQKFPDAALEAAKVKRAPFVAVSMMLSRHGNFKTGENIHPSIGTLADEAGVSKPTVRRVLAYLRHLGVLVKTGQQRNAGGGTPVTKYRLYRSVVVDDVLRINDRDFGRVNLETTENRPVENGEPLRVKLETTEGKAGDHNRNNKKRIGSSVEESPSPAPLVALPSARDGAAEEGDTPLDWIDQLLSEISGGPL